MLRRWFYLRHNLALDLVALNRHEMVLWDVWGLDATEEAPSDTERALLDEVAAVTDLDGAQRLFARDELRVPPVVLSFSPENPFPPREVTLRVGGNHLPT